MASIKVLFAVILISKFLRPALCNSHQLKRQSNDGDPLLQMTVTHFLKNSSTITYGSDYEYSFLVKHSSESQADARGVHVTWMLTPFVKMRKVTSSSLAGSYRVEQQNGDSVTFKINHIPLESEAHFNFSVIFDGEHTLKTGLRRIVTPVQLLYYKEYGENQQGHVILKGAAFSSPLQTVALEVEIPGCSAALGMASGLIKEYQLTASSTYSQTRPNQARPGAGNDAWCAFISDIQQYIQLDFAKNTRVTRIVTYGRNQKSHWVKRYMLQFSSDAVLWHNYTENGFVKEFAGNSDRSTPVSHQLLNDIEAYSLRLRPLDWERLICMRFEVFGCSAEGPDNCIYPLGLESGEIPDEALTHSVDTPETTSDPLDIRFNKDPRRFPNGWQAAVGKLDYIQVDFGSLRKVTRIASQGSAGSDFPFYVKTFQLKYSNNSIDWLDYSEHGRTKKLRGPKNAHEAKVSVVVKLLEPITARYVRMIPISAPTLKVMRAEIYGCVAEPMPPLTGVTEYHRRAVLLDPASGWLYVCMYTGHSAESSCFSSSNGKHWRDIPEFIISVIALDSRTGAFYGLGREMNFHRSTDHGVSWKVVSSKHFYNVKNETSLLMNTGIPENMVSLKPESFWSAATSSGRKWGVSSHGIHTMPSGQSEWSMVASWKCCGN